MRELTPKEIAPDAKSFLKQEAKGLLKILLTVLGEQLVKLFIKFLKRHNDTRVVGYDEDLFI